MTGTSVEVSLPYFVWALIPGPRFLSGRFQTHDAHDQWLFSAEQEGQLRDRQPESQSDFKVLPHGVSGQSEGQTSSNKQNDRGRTALSGFSAWGDEADHPWSAFDESPHVLSAAEVLDHAGLCSP